MQAAQPGEYTVAQITLGSGVQPTWTAFPFLPAVYLDDAATALLGASCAGGFSIVQTPGLVSVLCNALVPAQ